MQPAILSNCEPDDDINLFSKDDMSNCSGEESDSSSPMTQAFSSTSTTYTIDV